MIFFMIFFSGLLIGFFLGFIYSIVATCNMLDEYSQEIDRKEK